MLKVTSDGPYYFIEDTEKDKHFRLADCGGTWVERRDHGKGGWRFAPAVYSDKSAEIDALLNKWNSAGSRPKKINLAPAETEEKETRRKYRRARSFDSHDSSSYESDADSDLDDGQWREVISKQLEELREGQRALLRATETTGKSTSNWYRERGRDESPYRKPRDRRTYRDDYRDERDVRSPRYRSRRS